MGYFVVHNIDGDAYVYEFPNIEEVVAHYGEGGYFEKTPEKADTNYWPEGQLLIKGEIVTLNPMPPSE